METWTKGDMEMETYKHGDIQVDMETWTWRQGHRDMELKDSGILTFYEKIKRRIEA
jgi:hypothetical protein